MVLDSTILSSSRDFVFASIYAFSRIYHQKRRLSNCQTSATFIFKLTTPPTSKTPMPTTGKLELTIKINELPQAKTLQNGWQSFELDCDGRIVSVSVKPKVWKKLTEAQANFPMWVAAISGQMGQATADGFELEQPSIQVFEKKPKAEAAPPQE
jgi:hypothetical protein